MGFGCLHQGLFQSIGGSRSLRNRLPLGFRQSIALLAHQTLKIIIALVAAFSKYFIKVIRQVGPQLRRLFGITKYQLKSLHPASRNSVLYRVDSIIKGTCFLTGFKYFQTKGINLIAHRLNGFRGSDDLSCICFILNIGIDLVNGLGVIIVDLHHDITGKPSVIRQMLCKLRFIKSLRFCHQRLVGAICIFLQGAQCNTGVQAFLSEFIGIHTCILNTLVVLLAHNTSTHCLAQLVHRTACSSGILARCCSPKGNTLHCCNRFFQSFAGSGEFSNILLHVGKVIAGFISKPVKLLHLLIYIFQGISLGNQCLGSFGLSTVFIPTGRDLIHGKRFHKHLTGGDCLIGNTLQSRDTNYFQSTELLLYSINSALQTIKVHRVCRICNTLQSLAGSV